MGGPTCEVNEEEKGKQGTRDGNIKEKQKYKPDMVSNSCFVTNVLVMCLKLSEMKTKG